MSIKNKALSVIAGLGVIFLGSSLVVFRLAILPAFQDLELQLSAENQRRVERALQTEIQELIAINRDWSGWDDTYRFMQDRNDAYRRSNLDESSLTTVRVNVMAMVATDGEVVWGEAIDLGTGKSLHFDTLFQRWLSAAPGLVSHDSVDSGIAGMVSAGTVPALVASRGLRRAGTLVREPFRGAFEAAGSELVRSIARGCQAAWDSGPR